MKENLIVTGGLGFIGSNLIQLLINKKYKVFTQDCVPYFVLCTLSFYLFQRIFYVTLEVPNMRVLEMVFFVSMNLQSL